MAYTKILVNEQDKEEFKRQIAERSKRNWSNPEYRAKQSESRRRAWTPERRANAGQRIAKFNSTAKAKASRSISSKKNWQDQAIRSRMTANMTLSHAERSRREGPNEFESRCYAFLSSIHAEYIAQHPIPEAATVVDAYIPEARLCVYFDSEYWHSKPENILRDSRIRARLETLGYAVSVIRGDRWVRQINQADLDAMKERLCGLR